MRETMSRWSIVAVALVLLSSAIALLSPSPSRAATVVDIVILGGNSAVSATVAAQLEECTLGSVTRAAGLNRYQTATEISKSAFTSANHAFIATGFNFPDALAGGPPAATSGEPVLLVNDAVPASTFGELARLGVSSITVLGGSAVVPDSVVASLNAAVPTTRIAGSNRYATAAAIVQAKFTSAATVYVATGLNFPDALAGVPAAAGDSAPILLVKPDSIPGTTATQLKRLKPTTIKILGGTAAVSQSVADSLEGFAPNVIRLAGPDRYSTATAISKHAFPNGSSTIYIATGLNYPDALAGGPAAGDRDAPILLVRPDSIPGATRTEIQRITGVECKAPPPLRTFGDGTWRVGADIQAGTYRTDPSSGTCYGARLSGFSGEFDDIIANELSSNSIIVTIEATDTGFESSRCNLWSNDLSPRTGSPTAGFGDGSWQVGIEVAPGLWRNSDSSETCYWERLSGFSWEFSDLIANGLSDSIQTVQVQSGDVGFTSSRCGKWTYLGP